MWTQLEKIKVPLIVTSQKTWIFSSTFDSLALEAAVSSSAELGIHWLIQPRKSNTKYWVLSREAVGTTFIVSGMTRLGIQHMAYTPPLDHWAAQWVTQSTSVKVLSHPGSSCTRVKLGHLDLFLRSSGSQEQVTSSQEPVQLLQMKNFYIK